MALDLASDTVRVVSKLEMYVYHPFCSQDGKGLLMTGGYDRGQIVHFDLISGKVNPFVVSNMCDYGPSLSRDGKTFSFVRKVRQYMHGFGGTGWTDADVWVGAAGSDSYRKVTHMKARAIGPGVFLPDDRHLMLSMKPGDKLDIYLLDLADGTKKQLTLTGNYNLDPSLSPDGKTVVFASNRTEKFKSELWRMLPDGSGAQQITQLGRRCTEPKFLQDGHSVVFLIGQQIWRVDIDGKNLRKLYPANETQKDPM